MINLLDIPFVRIKLQNETCLAMEQFLFHFLLSVLEGQPRYAETNIHV